MKTFMRILLLAGPLLLLSPAYGSPTAETNPSDDLVVSGDMVFEGQAFKDGPNITFTGTAQGWYKHVRGLNSNYEEDFAGFLSQQRASWAEMEKDMDADQLEPRGTDNATSSAERKHHGKFFHGPKCQAAAPGEAALTVYAKEGIRYLHQTNAICNTPKWACHRVSCDENAGIFMCDDNHTPNKAPCDKIANLAKRVVKRCSFYDFPDRMTRGTCQSGHGWYVRVNAGGC